MVKTSVYVHRSPSNRRVRRRKALVRNRCHICGRFCGQRSAVCQSCELGNDQRNMLITKRKVFTGMGLSEVCDLCARQSTEHYPIILRPVRRAAIRQGRYGKHLPDRRSRNYLQFCGDCYEYVVHKRKSWRYGWAAVLYTVIFGTLFDHRCKQDILKLIPNIILESWKYCLNIDFESPIQDFTQHLKDNPLPTNDLSMEKFISFAEVHALPCVLCPFGCHISPLNGGYGFLPFTHLLNYVDSSIRVFTGNGRRLQSVHTKWLRGWSNTLFGWNVVQAGVSFHDIYGLCILTCRDHSAGCMFQNIYMPEQPVLGHVALSEADNLSLATIKPRVIKTGRTGLYCSSWSLYAARFSSSGVSTFTLSDEVRWRSICSRMARSNALVIMNRPDILSGLYRRVVQGQLPPHVLRDLLQTSTGCSKEEEELCLTSATLIDLEDIIRLKEYSSVDAVSASSSAGTTPQFFYAHKVGIHGARPLTPELWGLPSDREIGYDPLNVFIWVLLVFNTICPIIATDLLKVSTTSSWQQFCRVAYRRILDDLFSCQLCKLNKVSRSVKRFKVRLSRWLSHIGYDFGTLFQFNSAQVLRTIIHNFFRASDSSIVLFNFVNMSGFSVLLPRLPHNVSWHILLDSSERSRSGAVSRDAVTSIIDTCTSCGLQVQAVFDFRNVLLEPFGYISHGKYRHGYWECSYGCHAINRDITIQDVLGQKCWSLYLLTRRSGTEAVNKYFGSLMGIIGGQLCFVCGVHDVLLVKETFPSKAHCSYSSCVASVKHKAIFSCPYRDSCGVGICRKVYDAFILSGVPGFAIKVYPVPSVGSNGGTDIPVVCSTVDDGDDDEDFCSILSVAAESVVDDAPFFVGDPDINDEYNSQHVGDPCLLTSTADDPWLFGEVPVAASILFNSICGVLRRKGYPVNVPRYAQRFFQNMMSLSKSPVCLAYPESTLFPSLFWCDYENDAIGAIPVCLHSERFNHQSGFSSYRDHCVYRLRDWSSLSMADSRYCLYMFDVCLNEMMRYSTQSLTLKRGWEHISGDSHDVKINMKEQYLAFDAADSRRNVRELSSLIAQQCPRYFITLTCNQRGTPCVRLVTTIREGYLRRYPAVSEKDAIESSCTPYVTTWYNWVCLFLEYLYQGNDDILGPITGYWGRFEWQSCESTLPHFHCLLWCNEPIEVSKRRIVCNLSQFKSFKDSVIERGLVTSNAEWEDVCESFSRFQRHSCAASKGRCQRYGSDGKSYCRVPHYTPSPSTEYSPIIRRLTDQELDVFISLGWASYVDDNHYQLRPDFQPGKYNYATSDDIKWVPVNPYIFTIFRSSCNVLLVDWDMASRYLASYCGGAEEHVKTSFRSKGDNLVDVNIHNVENVKLMHGQHPNAARVKRGRSELCKRIVSKTEALFYVLKYRYVHTNARFSHPQTSMLEDRPVWKKSRKLLSRFASARGEPPVQIRVRSSLPDI